MLSCWIYDTFYSGQFLPSLCKKAHKGNGNQSYRDRDRLGFEVMQRDGRNLNHYKRACHIKDKKEIAAVIAPYFKKSAKQIQVSLFHMNW